MNPRNKIIALLSLLTVIIIFTWSCQQEDEFVPLKIDSVSPVEVLVGDTITLMGAGFSPDFATNEVYFSGIVHNVAPVKGTTSNQLVVPVPDSATTGSIRVNILGEEVFDSPPLTIRTPIFESITPNTGYVGDTIVIKGENFRSDRNNNHVKFVKIQGDGVLAEVTHSTNTELHVIVPEQSKAGNISVLGFQGPKFNFKVGKITGISPTKGVAGDTLTITGVGFLSRNETSIYFNQGVSAITDWEGSTSTSREMRTIVPPGALNGKIRMDVLIGQKTYSLLSDAIFQMLPSIESLSSPSGPPGYPLTIKGSGFAPKPTNVVSASINNVPAIIKSFDSQNIVVTVPENASSGQVKVTVNGNEATGPEFQVAATGTPVLERLSKSEGYVGDEITIYGLYFSPEVGGNVVKFGSETAMIKEASSTALKVTVPEGAVTGNVSVSSLGIQTANELPFTVRIPAADFKITEVTPRTISQGRTLTVTGTNLSTQGDIAIYITQAFGAGFSYELWHKYTTVTSSTITADVESFNDPTNGHFRIIYAPGKYYVSIRKASDGRSTEDLSNKKEITIEGATPNIKSITPSESYVGDIVTITGENFDGTDLNNVVKFNDTHDATIVGPDDNNPKTLRVKVPEVPKGDYKVTVTTGTQTSVDFQFKVLEKVATTVQPKPVYYLGNDGSNITLNKLIKVNDSQTSTHIFSTSKSGDGITSMLVDLAASKIYMSQFSFQKKEEDGIFSMPLDGKSKKRIVITKEPDGEGSPGDGQYVSDLGLNTEDNRLFWSTTDNFELLTAKTNDNSIKKPDVLTKIPVGNKPSPYVYGVTYSNGKVYYIGSFDDPNDNGKGQSEIFSFDITSRAVTKIFSADDKLGIVYDLKIDEENNKMYMLSGDAWADRPPIIYKANLDGENLKPLLEFESDIFVYGISLDLDASHIYWLQEKSGAGQTIQMARMDGVDIGPGGQRQIAYRDLKLNTTQYAGSIAVEASGGGAAGRVGSMSLQLKYRLKKRK